MSIVRDKFEQLKKQGKKAFIPYLTYGFPNRRVFEQVLIALDEAGSDLIEVGMPFSDPVADGPVIQHSSQVALSGGVTIEGLLADLKRLRPKIKATLLLMTYYNPVFHMGDSNFCARAKGVIDGVVVPDLLPEEADNFIRACRANNIDTVFFISPTTDTKRYSMIDKYSTGFIYYVSVTGTTGSRNKFSKDIYGKISAARKKVKAPVCVGFGVSTPQAVKKFWEVSDGVIVGSAIIRFIGENFAKEGFTEKLKKYIKGLMGR